MNFSLKRFKSYYGEIEQILIESMLNMLNKMLSFKCLDLSNYGEVFFFAVYIKLLISDFTTSMNCQICVVVGRKHKRMLIKGTCW